ncbi:MAG TPA: sulfur carrier protein ThiS [Thermoplasmatales archaeon]|nr:sulfur carrier protein ThiS [Thermoplasmatales archaeon]
MIEINGRNIKWKKGETVQDLLRRTNLNYPIVIVKIDGKMIPKDRFSEVYIRDNSSIDVVPIVSGG